MPTKASSLLNLEHSRRFATKTMISALTKLVKTWLPTMGSSSRGEPAFTCWSFTSSEWSFWRRCRSGCKEGASEVICPSARTLKHAKCLHVQLLWRLEDKCQQRSMRHTSQPLKASSIFLAVVSCDKGTTRNSPPISSFFSLSVCSPCPRLLRSHISISYLQCTFLWSRTLGHFAPVPSWFDVLFGSLTIYKKKSSSLSCGRLLSKATFYTIIFAWLNPPYTFLLVLVIGSTFHFFTKDKLAISSAPLHERVVYEKFLFEAPSLLSSPPMTTGENLER